MHFGSLLSHILLLFHRRRRVGDRYAEEIHANCARVSSKASQPTEVQRRPQRMATTRRATSAPQLSLFYISSLRKREAPSFRRASKQTTLRKKRECGANRNNYKQ